MTAMKARRVRDYIEHIVAAIGRIESYVEGIDRAAFIKSSLVQDAVIRNFEIIGEAANKIRTVAPEFAQQQAHLRLELAYAMRNALTHGYDSVNLLTVWNTIHNDLPTMKQQMAEILRALKYDE
ncbi:HepT-like ribonuclease domain-containing protein [Methylocystis heyeri]|uniref:DUF86 domain-containing protein n=1 Tax=Methylocystis heyeri TaxID=391905 RepID=A0A6B8KDE9_9HYPH|nr:HepT-like ribonuclease domain-containing protein [Methylocystis heyeri]QGM46464.1 DUF86 domain-containing protein [Methylocystis heyeri]